MLKEERQEQILKLLQKEEMINNELISKKLSIPITTLRRDILELEEQEKIIKLHGGIKLNKPSIIIEKFIDNKIDDEVKEKEIIAKLCLDKINKGDYIFIDAGSSTYYLTKMLDSNLNLNIVTNSIIHAQNLITNGHKNIFLLGGKLNINLGSIVGYEAIQVLEKYHFDKAFIGVNAIDNGNNLYTTSSEQAQLKDAVLKNSNNSFILSTSSKMNNVSFYKFGVDNTYQIITEKGEIK